MAFSVINSTIVIQGISVSRDALSYIQVDTANKQIRFLDSSKNTIQIASYNETDADLLSSLEDVIFSITNSAIFSPKDTNVLQYYKNI